LAELTTVIERKEKLEEGGTDSSTRIVEDFSIQFSIIHRITR
jgi:hypothetical protein